VVENREVPGMPLQQTQSMPNRIKFGSRNDPMRPPLV
jgi:hypothetical protein